MQLIINGEKIEFKEGITISEILKELKIEEKAMAVAVNMEIVKKDKWEQFSPKGGDKIEILQFVGGG
jgi:sulfur carrier protein